MAKIPGTGSKVAEFRPMTTKKPLSFDLRNVIDVIMMMERQRKNGEIFPLRQKQRFDS
ncbi:hypothetical protein IYY11_13935 [Methylocystis sp. H62]|uniref:hypothetical protein n=1 Tax=Methylocystis sp. H62 TaxID=2785789 RepID=UPI0018C33699|nr:hypothetical protein [Methylocystis sp. H62]MBG0794454.1 hypothetical protein [Methylocystis sp. H62]